MALHDFLDRVIDRRTFLDFVEALIDDRVADRKKERDRPSDPFGRSVNGWENGTIEAFLGAAVAWAEASSNNAAERDGEGFPEQPTWKSFATFLYCGKIYE